MTDVLALGELLVDFYSAGESDGNDSLFEACPGGAPCNVLSMLTQLGRKTAFIGKVGSDLFGRRLEGVIRSLGIDTSGVVFDTTVPTTLAFVSTDSRGERSFAFYRNPGADMMLETGEVDSALLKACRIFHFGTLSSTHATVREATRTAVSAAQAAGALISFDPNLRPALWDSLENAREQMAWGCAHCDILKISDDEAEFLTGEKAPRRCAEALQVLFPTIRLILITSGDKGSAVLWRDLYVEVPAVTVHHVLDTTGAGDSFCACVLDTVLNVGLEDFSECSLQQLLRFANCAAAIVVSRKGALQAMPSRAEVEALCECVSWCRSGGYRGDV